MPASDAVASRAFEILSGDAGPGGLMRVKQRAARADAKNLNRRIYPREVFQAAIDAARPMARAGAMLCEMRHPDVANTPAGQKYVHNPDRVTARVDEISDVEADGWVYVTRTILDTPQGRIVADAFEQASRGVRKAIGISTRFRMRGHPATVGGDSVDVATWMEIFTWDDVENPAVVGAGEPVPLSDAVLETLSLPPAAEDAAPTPRPAPHKTMNLSALRAALAALIVANADSVKVANARTDYHAAYAEADSAAKSEERAHAVTLELDAIRAGYAFEADAPPSVKASLPKAPAKKEETPASDAAPTLTPEQAQRVEALLARDAADEAKRAVRAAVNSLAEKEPFKNLDAQTRAHVLDRTAARALKADEVEAIAADELDGAMAILAEANLKAQGYVKADGKTVPATVIREARPWMENVDKILAAADDFGRTSINGENPNDPATQARRKHNRALLEPILERVATHKMGADSLEAWLGGNDMKSVGDSFRLVSDATTLGNAYNQPTILTAFIIQSFQDMRFLDFVQAFGPGKGENGGWTEAADGIGSVLRLPVEYWADPANYGIVDGTYDAGLLTPEGIGIDEGSVNTTWLSYAPAWMRIAASITRDASRALANGPANYGLIGRTLYHMAFRKSRSTDKYIADEMLGISDEYAAVAVAGEAYTSGNGAATLNLVNNSVFNAGGSISVNLNPAKLANAAIVAGTDPFVMYGANVVAALRLRTRGAQTAGLYAGTSWGTDPVVRPRTNVDLTAQGQKTSSTSNPFSVTAPGGMIMGYLGGDGQVRAIPGVNGTPTFAVDWENGVVVFTAAAGLAGATGAITTAVTVSYTYATNFDNFQVNNLNLNGITVENYLNGLLGRLDTTKASMGSAPRFMAPNLAIMSLNAATWFQRATIFYKLNSPNGTELYPTPDYFFDRNGVMGASHNAPWNAGDRRILLTRQGATKYGIDTPLEMAGPFPKYDTSGRLIATDAFYAQENRVICTPQVQDQSGNVLNPVNRTIILR